MKIYVTIITFLLISSLNPNYNDGKDEISAEEYAVYSAYLNGFDKSPNDGKPVKLVVVNNETVGPITAFSTSMFRNHPLKMFSHE